MDPPDADFEARLAAHWAALDELTEDDFLAQLDSLVDELPPGSPIAMFERAGALDSTGHSDIAVSLYQQALEQGLPANRRRRAVIQLASSLRNVGRVDESLALLLAERDAGTDQLDDAVSGFLALALVDAGREREAVSVALTALSGHMDRYRRSLANYASLLFEPPAE